VQEQWIGGRDVTVIRRGRDISATWHRGDTYSLVASTNVPKRWLVRFIAGLKPSS
jgi:hypothetical protein